MCAHCTLHTLHTAHGLARWSLQGTGSRYRQTTASGRCTRRPRGRPGPGTFWPILLTRQYERHFSPLRVDVFLINQTECRSKNICWLFYLFREGPTGPLRRSSGLREGPWASQQTTKFRKSVSHIFIYACQNRPSQLYCTIDTILDCQREMTTVRIHMVHMLSSSATYIHILMYPYI